MAGATRSQRTEAAATGASKTVHIAITGGASFSAEGGNIGFNCSATITVIASKNSFVKSKSYKYELLSGMLGYEDETTRWSLDRKMTKLIVLPLLLVSLLGCRDDASVATKDRTVVVEMEEGASSRSPMASLNGDRDSMLAVDDGQVSLQIDASEDASVGAADASLLSGRNSRKSVEPGAPVMAPRKRPDADFERMLQGFLRCHYEGMWVPDVIGHRSEFPENPYFEKHDAKSCGGDEEFSHYCVEEVFHGLDVTRITVPIQGGVPRVSVFVSQDLRLARRVLGASVGSEFRESRASAEGLVPELQQDPQDVTASVLVCSREF